MQYRSAILLCFADPKVAKCNSFQVTSDLTHYGSYRKVKKVVITHSGILMHKKLFKNFIKTMK